jgi:sirohydrochlorin cobaltochelatase
MKQVRNLIITIWAVVSLSACSTAEQSAGVDHAAHAMHMQNTAPDAQGRQLYGMKHDMSPEMLAELRTRPVFAGYTDEQLVKVMGLMGSNYTWPVTADTVVGKRGALILVHGFGDHGDAVLRQQLQAGAAERPTSLAIGMSMMTSAHIQLGLDDLTAAGAKKIVVVPVVSTRHNTLMRQWDYIFDRSDEPEYGRVPQVATRARLKFAAPLDDHPLVGEIILDYVNEVSEQPAKEEIIIVGHGPVDPDDNRDQLALMEHLAAMVRAGGDFAAVNVISLQDDAPAEVRRARIQELRTMVSGAQARGNQAIVVTNLLGTRIVQSSLRRALRGLPYRYNFKGLVQHEKFIDWVNLSIEENL